MEYHLKRVKTYVDVVTLCGIRHLLSIQKNPFKQFLKVLILFVFVHSAAIAGNTAVETANPINPINPAKALKTRFKPVIDGIIEEQYMEGLLFNSFKQIVPSLFSDATVKTEIYFMYDEENIYIAGNVYQKREQMKASSGKRDSNIIAEGDFITIAIDPLNSGNTAYFFSVNPFNAVYDGITDGTTWNPEWDGIFQTSTKIHEDRWVFEFHLPLSSINFQNKKEQDWGIMIFRNFAFGQERIMNQITDKNNPTRIADFFRLTELKNLRQSEKFKATPYNFHAYSNDGMSNESTNNIKIGGEFNYKPVPSISLLSTINPDFAQIEADEVIINVNDVPVSLPERRPFFTESKDMYPGLAVNTRNINEIKAGLKMRQVLDKFKYDFTWVQDNDNAHWLMGNAKWMDNKTFKAEVVSGLKNTEAFNHYNLTSNLQLWAFKRRLTAYNWFGKINTTQNKNEFETVNSVRWETREFKTGLWSHYKSEYYNPNIIGHNTLSNELVISGWVSYALLNTTEFFQQINQELKIDRLDLSSHKGNEYFLLNYKLTTVMKLNEDLGVWKLLFSFRPKMNNYFRNRITSFFNDANIYSDSFSDFQLVKQNRNIISVNATTDNTKSLGFSLGYRAYEVRKSKASAYEAKSFWKISPNTNISYEFETVHLEGSVYQKQFMQQLHKLKMEHNFSEKFNLKAMAQINNLKMIGVNELQQISPLINITASWEYSKGSFIYAVFNKFSTTETKEAIPGEHRLMDKQFAAIKINKTFNF